MYNKVVMLGNLTRDIELRYLPSGSAVAKTAIASSYKYKSQTGEQKEEVCFLDLNFFGRIAEISNQYLKKGSKVLVEGRLVFEQWTDTNGQNRSRHTLRVDEMKMLDSKRDSEENGYSENQGYGYQAESYNRQQQVQGQRQGKHWDNGNNNRYIPSSNENQEQNNHTNTSKYVPKEIPEIDLDEEEIPF